MNLNGWAQGSVVEHTKLRVLVHSCMMLVTQMNRVVKKEFAHLPLLDTVFNAGVRTSCYSVQDGSKASFGIQRTVLDPAIEKM